MFKLSEHILIIDDEVAIRDMVRMALEMEGFTVSDASSAHSAQKKLSQGLPDLILLDWMMPGLSGIDFAAQLKKNDDYKEVGIIMLTAKDDEDDRIRGLDVGADDYICKPFSTKELISRIRAVNRRIKKTVTNGSIINAGLIQINPDTHQVLINKQEINLSPTEFRLLHFFSTHQDRVFSRAQLLDHVWGEQVYVEDRTVDVHIRRLRKVLEKHECHTYIKTIRSAGYSFSSPSK